MEVDGGWDEMRWKRVGRWVREGMGERRYMPIIRKPGAGDTAMKSAPKMLRMILPRVTIRSLTAALSPKCEVRTEYRTGKMTMRMKKLARALSGMRKLD